MHFSFIYFLFKQLSHYQVRILALSTQKAITQLKIHTKSVVGVYSRLRHVHAE